MVIFVAFKIDITISYSSKDKEIMCFASLWKAMKITFFRRTKFVMKSEKITELRVPTLVSFFSDKTLL